MRLVNGDVCDSIRLPVLGVSRSNHREKSIDLYNFITNVSSFIWHRGQHSALYGTVWFIFVVWPHGLLVTERGLVQLKISNLLQIGMRTTSVASNVRTLNSTAILAGSLFSCISDISKLIHDKQRCHTTPCMDFDTYRIYTRLSVSTNIDYTRKICIL